MACGKAHFEDAARVSLDLASLVSVVESQRELESLDPNAVERDPSAQALATARGSRWPLVMLIASSEYWMPPPRCTSKWES
jgi:hypothetical protein